MQITGIYTDQYQLAMGQAYFLERRAKQTAIFDYFFRKLPFGSGYAIFAGLENLLDILENLRFTESDIEFLQKQGLDARYLAYLKDFRFRGAIYSTLEGDVVFPSRPILVVEASIVEAQIIETVLLNMLNFQTLIATKASRMRLAAGQRTLIDFGMRRAHGLAAYHASRAVMIGGFEATSNVKAGKDFDLPVSGTMAHSFVQSYEDELSAFRCFAKVSPDNCVLLVDTYNTLKSGLPNAITVAKELAAKGQRLKGIRLDSGDLAYLSKKCRKMLDDAGLPYVKIAVSNQMDEFVIKSLVEQAAPIDIFGVGTKLATGQPDAALGGVYKLAFTNGQPRIKLSENTSKTTFPHKKQVYRLYDADQEAIGADVVTLWEEEEIGGMQHPFDFTKSIDFGAGKREKLLHLVMKNGQRTTPAKSVAEIAKYSKERLQKLPDGCRRFLNPHRYKIGLSPALKKERDQLIAHYQKK
ncbi:MAG: nicotinate phosphoribosyltransferase [Bacteroidota bacterium]